MKLYYFAGACSLADHIVLEWIGEPYETKRMTLQSVKAPEFLVLNPHGTVPVLTDGDFVLTQNVAILTYLADQNSDARLLGDGSLRARADTMRWLGFLNSDVHPAFKPLFAPARFLPDPALASALAASARANVRAYLGRIDKQLEGREWLTGQRSVADPYLYVLLRWALRRKVDVAGLENLARFGARMHADAGVRAVLEDEEGANTTPNEETYRDPSQPLRMAADLRVQRDRGAAGA
jgi:glutathione S-transferase